MNKRLIYTLHGLKRWSSEDEKAECAGIKCFLEELVASLADAVISVSPVYLHYLKDNWNVENIVHIPNGVNSAKFYPVGNEEEKIRIRRQLGLPIGKILFTYVGNLDLPEKVRGLKDFFSAFVRINENTRNQFRFSIVGDGQEMVHLQKEVQKRNLDEYVRFMGYRSDIPDVLQASDVFVLTSRNEGSPNALLEAMSSGLPCLAARCGSIPQVLNEAGKLVEPGDIEGIRDGILTLGKDKGLRKQMGKQARARILMYFTWKRVATKTIEMYV